MSVVNKLIKTMSKDRETEVRGQIKGLADEIINIFITNKASVAMVKDVIETINRHYDRALLLQQSENIFRKEE